MNGVREMQKAASEELDMAERALQGAAPIELCGEHIRQAEEKLRRVVAQAAGNEYIGEIFRNFCLGK